MATSTRKRGASAKASESLQDKEIIIDPTSVEGQPEAAPDTEAIAEKKSSASKRKIVAKDVDLNQYITVRNGCRHPLIYVSSRTGERFNWEEFGDEQYIELLELRTAKNSQKNFFVNNWFMFDDDWVIDYLGVGQFYKNAVSIDNFDSIFEKKGDDLKAAISKLSNGQKRTVAYRAKELIKSHEIDSLSTITVLEDVLGIGLIEK